jgi:hypothetical protein
MTVTEAEIDGFADAAEEFLRHESPAITLS